MTVTLKQYNGAPTFESDRDEHGDWIGLCSSCRDQGSCEPGEILQQFYDKYKGAAIITHCNQWRPKDVV